MAMAVVLCVCLVAHDAQAAGLTPADVPRILDAVRQKGHPGEVVATQGAAPLELNTEGSFFLSEQPLLRPVTPRDVDEAMGPLHEDKDRDKDIKYKFSVVTSFDPQSPTVHKRSVIRQGPNRGGFTTTLLEPSSEFTQHNYSFEGRDYKVYLGEHEAIVYEQSANDQGGADLKEWIYAQTPNTLTGSAYAWEFNSDEFNRFVYFQDAPDGGVDLWRYPKISGVKADDYPNKLHIVGVIDQVLGKQARVVGKNRLARIPEAVYWTNRDQKLKGTYKPDGRTLRVVVPASVRDYPLIIDPTLSFSPSPSPGGRRFVIGNIE